MNVKFKLIPTLDVVESMLIPEADRKQLFKQMDMAEQYQKIRHSGHCSDCMNIIATLEEISQHIQKITDKEIAQEAKFDFENASEHIIKWLRHNLRAARQDCEKKFIISQMEEDEAFCTFDWDQKILSQEYREAQSAYFGKKGMSVVAGSFVWKDSAANLANTAATTISLYSPSYCTESYVVAIPDAAQTELDTLSAGEIITKQFKTDHPHIQKLHKRTDNIGNFSSYATSEAERLICERVSCFLNYLTLIELHSVAGY